LIQLSYCSNSKRYADVGAIANLSIVGAALDVSTILHTLSYRSSQAARRMWRFFPQCGSERWGSMRHLLSDRFLMYQLIS
jgi:hypothetical protein